MTEIRLALPQRSPQPLIVPWTWVQPASIPAKAFATATSQSLWVWMPRRVGIGLAHHPDHLGDGAGEAAAVRVAHRDPVGAGGGGGLHGRERVLAIGAEAVEEVLAVVDDLAPLLLEEGDAVRDHRQVLLEGRADDLGDVQGPGLADDRDRRRLGGDHRAAGSGRCRRARPPCGSSRTPSASRGGGPSVLARWKNSTSFGLDPG